MPRQRWRRSGHVARLALPTLLRLAAAEPLLVGVLEELAVHAAPVRGELVAGGAEAAVGKRSFRLEAAVRAPGIGRQLHRVRAGHRAEAFVAAHVAGGAGEPAQVQVAGHPGGRWRGRRIRPAALERHQGLLFRERRMAAQAIVAVLLVHGAQLPQDAGPHGAAVQARLPVRELRRVADAARLRGEGGLFRGVRCGRVPLRGDGGCPMTCEELLDVLAGPAFGYCAVAGPDRDAGEDDQGRPAGDTQGQPQGLPPGPPPWPAVPPPGSPRL